MLVIIAGPVFGNFIAKRVDVPVPTLLARDEKEESDDAERAGRNPGVAAAVLTVLLPIVLMLGSGIANLTLDKSNGVRKVLDILGNPPVALLLGVLLAMWTLGKRAGFDRRQTSAVIGGALPPIAGILLIVAAGGGFKQVLVDAGVGNVVADAAKDANISALLRGFLVAVGYMDPGNWATDIAGGSAFGYALLSVVLLSNLMAIVLQALSVRLGVASGLDLAGGHRRPAGRDDGPVAQCPAGLGDRRGVAVLLARQRRRVLAGQGVLRDDRRADHQDVVGDGDDHLGGRLPRRAAPQPHRLVTLTDQRIGRP